jgi:hypothetical protein
MCYSAQIWADYRRYVRAFGAELSIKEFFDIFWRRKGDSRVKLPKGMEAAFGYPSTGIEHEIKALNDEFVAEQTTKLEQELFKQRKRLADAERALQTKTTKAASESKRIATDKIDWALGKLSDLRRTELKDDDARIFPGHYAPVMVMENGRRVIKPMHLISR